MVTILQTKLKFIFLQQICSNSILILVKFIPKGPINKPALVQKTAWCRQENMPLSEPMMAQFTDPWPLFTKKTPSYQYRDSHYKPETVVRPS